MNFKLGFGPMSLLINETLATYAKEKQRPLMIIASRNQVDANSGYVMTTKQLAEQINPLRSEYLMLCRDHCGPYFLDVEKSLDERAAIEATKQTIASDIENGFDLIHIDTSRCQDPYSVAEDLIKFCLDLNSKIKFEFGTEENIGATACISKYQHDVKFASQFPNMEFVVAQTGSLVMEDKQIGSFDPTVAKKLVNYANSSNLKLKEHNADYLTVDQIKLRKLSGVHACNIAPQLGVIQTKTIINAAKKYNIDYSVFADLVIQSMKWKKWMLNSSNYNKELCVLVSSHYCFGSTEYHNLMNKIRIHCNIENLIRRSILTCLDLYYENFYDSLV